MNWYTVRKYWNKAIPQTSRANPKTCNSMCDIKGLRKLCICGFATYNTASLLERTGSCPLYTSPCQNIPCSDASNILGSPIQSWLPFHSFMKWPLMASALGLSCLRNSPQPHRQTVKLLSVSILHDSKDDTALFYCLLTWGKSWHPWITFVAALIHCCFLGVENHLDIFLSQVSLAGWGLLLRAHLPLFHFRLDLSLISVSAQAWTPISWCTFSLQIVHFLFLFLLLAFFHCKPT